MVHFIDKDVIITEIEKRRKEWWFGSSIEAKYKKEECDDILSFLDTIEVKEVDLESYNKLKRTLSLSFMNFLDSNRREGKMCLSNGECFDIDKAFDELDFAKLFRYMEKYLKAQKGEEVWHKNVLQVLAALVCIVLGVSLGR